MRKIEYDLVSLVKNIENLLLPLVLNTLVESSADFFIENAQILVQS